MKLVNQQRGGAFAKLTLAPSQASSVPIYRQISEELQSFIIKDGVPEGCMLPDLHSLSKIANVSPRTMDRALLELVSGGVCIRRPKKGTYVGSPQVLAPRRPVCAVYCARGWTQIENDLVKLPIYRGIEKACRERDIDCLLINSDVHASLAAYSQNADLDLRGAIILSYESGGPVEALAAAFPSTRFVCLNYQIPDFEHTASNVFGIFNDDYAGGYQVGDFLVRRGHASFVACTLGQMRDENYVRRIEGYRQALKDHQLHAQADRVFTLSTERCADQVMLARTSADEILGAGPRPTAVFCVNDMLAAGIADCLATHGTAEDVDIFGYDKVDARFDRDPRFSSVAIDFSAMGERAINLLTSKQNAHPKVLRLTPELVVRTHRKGAVMSDATGTQEE